MPLRDRYRNGTVTGYRKSASMRDLCLCVMCGALYQFDETMRLIEVTLQKFAELPEKVRLEVIFFRQRSAMIMASILSNPSEPPN